jgi:iron complex outermembrane receptor protein
MTSQPKPSCYGDRTPRRRRHAGFFNSYANTVPIAEGDKFVLSNHFRHDFGGFSIVNIAAYQQATTYNNQDADVSPLNTLQVTNAAEDDTFSEEFQVTSPGGGNFNWIVGLYYLHDDGHTHDPTGYLQQGTLLAALGGMTVLQEQLVTNSYAAYGQATWEFAPGTRVTGGLRYTSDTRHIQGTTTPATGSPTSGDQQKTWTKVTYRATLDHDFSPDILGYISFNTGFKAGSFSYTAPTGPSINPENLTAYEAGLKTQLFSNAIRLNLAGFYYDYSDLQFTTRVGTLSILANAAKARIYGLDLDFEARLGAGLRWAAGLNVINAKYTSFPSGQITTVRPGNTNLVAFGDVSGNDMIEAPSFSAFSSINYSANAGTGHVDFNLTGRYTGKIYWSVDNRVTSSPYFVGNASVKWRPNDRWDLTVWSNNIFDTHYYSQASPLLLTGDVYVPAEPRTFGVKVGVHL